jgi:hypothetical protein
MVGFCTVILVVGVGFAVLSDRRRLKELAADDALIPVQRSSAAIEREARAAANLEAFLAEISGRGGRLVGEPVRVSAGRAGYIGWLVPLPGQTVELLISDTDYDDLRRTSMLASLLYVDGEAWWWLGAAGRIASP